MSSVDESTYSVSLWQNTGISSHTITLFKRSTPKYCKSKSSQGNSPISEDCHWTQDGLSCDTQQHIIKSYMHWRQSLKYLRVQGAGETAPLGALIFHFKFLLLELNTQVSLFKGSWRAQTEKATAACYSILKTMGMLVIMSQRNSAASSHMPLTYPA